MSRLGAVSREDLAPLVEAWRMGRDASDDPAVQRMVAAEIRRIHRAFDKLPIAVRFVDFDPYRNFEEMRDQVASTGQMLVFTGGSETPLWDAETNWRARAVHDWDHIVRACDFSFEGELEAYRHAAQCEPGLAPVYMSEIALQAAVRNFEGEFGKQKLVLLPPAIRRYAEELRGLGKTRRSSRFTDAVWLAAGMLEQGSAPELVMVHLGAEGYDEPTAIVILDAAAQLAGG